MEITFSNGEIITPYGACGKAEGWIETNLKDSFRSWSFLIGTGQCWLLQGWFGRTANDLIQSGYISPEGVIDWDEIGELVDLNN